MGRQRKRRGRRPERPGRSAFHGFSPEEARVSEGHSSSHRLDSLDSHPHGCLLFQGRLLPQEQKKHINIFTDNLLCSGKRRWKPTEKAVSARNDNGVGRVYLSLQQRKTPQENEKKQSPSFFSERLDESALQGLLLPEEQIRFYSDIQRAMTSEEDTPPPSLVRRGKESIGNPCGAALVPLDSKKVRNSLLPGNIICGVCGSIAFFKSVFQAKFMGTFTCDPCRSFVSKQVQALRKSENHRHRRTLRCVRNAGRCIVAPGNSSESVQCEACWLKLCLLGYHIESSVYSQLRSTLPKDMYVLKEYNSVWNPLLPHRGKVLEVEDGASLRAPLFQTFGKPLPKPTSPTHKSHIVNHRLPSNWYKKSSKVLSGERKGEWDVHLLTPDRKVLKNSAELKLYVAKTGSVIDSNIINFSLPQNTLTNDSNKISTIDDQSKVASSMMEVEEEIFCKESSSGLQDCVLSSTIKIPARRKLSSSSEDPSTPKVQRSEETCDSSSNNSPERSACVFAKKSTSPSEESPTRIFAKKSAANMDGSPPTSSRGEVFAKKSTPLSPKSPRKKSPEAQQQVQSSTPVKKTETDAVSSLALNRSRRRDKKLPLKFRDTISAFSNPKSQNDTPVSKKKSVDDLKKNEVQSKNISGSSTPTGNTAGDEVKPTKKSRSRRCGSCSGCRAPNCRSCYRCKDMVCYGGPGNLRRTCVKRICANTYLSPSEMPKGLPDDASSLLAKLSSTFKESPSESSSSQPLVIKPIETKGKPKLSYSALIAIALFNLPGQRGTLSMLYEYIMHKFPYFKTVDKSGWQNSIRHNLSLNKCFVRTERTDKDGNGKGSFWIFDPEKVKNGTIKNFEKLIDSEELFIEAESLKENVVSSAEVVVQQHPSSHQEYRELLDSEFKVVDKGVSLEYWEPYDLEQVMRNGMGVLSVGKSPHEAICFLCGSAGKDSVFIHCCVCCEPFHPFCVDPGDAPNSEEEEEWVCRRCAVCQSCGQPDGKQLKCSLCRHAYHEACLQEYQRRFLKEGHPWVCSHCLKCDSCGKADVSHYAEGLPLCAFCCRQRSKGSFCPLCKGCYEDDDYNSRMMECVQCGAWVHADCENLDMEKYTLLGSLPTNIEYVCKCDLPVLSNRKLLWKNKYHLVRKEEDEDEQTLLTLRSLTPSSLDDGAAEKGWRKQGGEEDIFDPPGGIVVDLPEEDEVVFPQEDDFSLNTFE